MLLSPLDEPVSASPPLDDPVSSPPLDDPGSIPVLASPVLVPITAPVLSSGPLLPVVGPALVGSGPVLGVAVLSSAPCVAPPPLSLLPVDGPTPDVPPVVTASVAPPPPLLLALSVPSPDPPPPHAAATTTNANPIPNPIDRAIHGPYTRRASPRHARPRPCPLGYTPCPMADASVTEVEVVVVGSGFSGIGVGVYLRRAGVTDFVLLEKADRVGGTWRENSYPGAACDVPSHLYSFSFAQNPTWTRAFSPQPEILDYLERCADDFQLRPHIRLGAEVLTAHFDAHDARWTVRCADGRSFRARALVLGNGALHVPAFPTIPGLADFAGKVFHSARWDHQHELRGRSVGVLGTGASAIQIVPAIAPIVGTLRLFQRTPAWVVPRPDHAIGPRARKLYAKLPGLQRLIRAAIYWQLEVRALGFAHAPILKFLEPLIRLHIARSVRDPALRARLIPSYRMGCKRILLSNDFYPALQRPNVELITDAIDHIEPAGVRTRDGVLHELDTLVLATGFRVNDYLAKIAITGPDGRDLNELWQREPGTYLGITVAGFPNLFLLMGPNTGLGHNSMIFMIEAQARYAVQCILALRSRPTLEVRPEVQRRFNAEIQARLAASVWQTGCRSWYQDEHGRNSALWPGFTFDYWRRTRRLRLADYIDDRQ